MRIKSLLADSTGILFGALLLFACSNHNEEKEQVDTLKLLVKSMSFMDPSVADKYPVMQSIGLFSTDKQLYNTSLLDNQKAVYNGWKWYFEGNREIRLGPDSIMLYGYYPYDPYMQSHEWLRLKTGDVDYMYGAHNLKGRGYINYRQPVAEIRMEHAMCMLKLDIRPIIELGGTTDRIFIESADYDHPLYSTGQINMLTDETGSLEVLTGEVDCALDGSGIRALLYMIPCKAANFNINIIVNGKKHTMKVKGMDFEKGTIRNFWLDFDVEQQKLFIKDFNIVEWTNGGVLDIDTSVNADVEK